MRQSRSSGGLVGSSLLNWAMDAALDMRTTPAYVMAESRLGVNTAIDGARQERREVRWPVDDEIVGALSPGAIIHAGTATVQTPDLHRWIVAAGTWLVVGLAALSYAARRPRD